MRSTSKAVLCALSLALMSCATPSSPPPTLTANLCTKPEPEPIIRDGAGIVQPVTDAEREATRRFLGAFGAVLDWGREGWRQREEARRQGCRKD